ncbi:hypothetical protein LIER_35675 [Lithospermum erythrorhizon]|uniref:Uncharacterized protein n=1 Tax=Lithospermum erythrorhizon TaxID=34254 RepID=A0AAV3NUR6_LITER
MEVASSHNNNSKQGGSSMKSKLMMSFYRSSSKDSKDSSTMQYYEYDYNNTTSPKVKHPTKAASVTKQGNFGGGDGYVHDPNGGGGDAHVDSKATNYISYVKERRRLEEINLAKCDGDKSLLHDR